MSKSAHDQQASSVPSRRQFLKRLGAVGAAGVAASYLPGALEVSRARATSTAPTPIKHIVIACQENRTFDHYYGYYPGAGSFGVPPGWSVPNGSGGTVAPYHLPLPITQDIGHSWGDIHNEWDNGKMDGFYTNDGNTALGYYNGSDLTYYYALASKFTLCGNYYCGLMGPTYPNRLYLWTGTSGGNTSNSISLGSLSYPTIADVLDAHGITWKCYNLGFLGSIFDPLLLQFNPLALFSQWLTDSRLYASANDYFNDLNNGTLPQVSWLIPGLTTNEHPPAPIFLGEQQMQKVISALMSSSAWSSSAFFLTYDEGGGFFDHMAPPVFDAYGAGFRVPMLVVSPYAKRGYLAPNLHEHSSVLKFIELVFNLPTMASVNHQFDKQTPGTNNDAANGQPYGPPAPPRDGRSDIGDMSDCFNFGHNSDYRPALPEVRVSISPRELDRITAQIKPETAER